MTLQCKGNWGRLLDGLTVGNARGASPISNNANTGEPRCRLTRSILPHLGILCPAGQLSVHYMGCLFAADLLTLAAYSYCRYFYTRSCYPQYLTTTEATPASWSATVSISGYLRSSSFLVHGRIRDKPCSGGTLSQTHGR